MKPEWIIYKNEQKIGQAVTWHKALDILMKQENMTHIGICKYSRILTIATPFNINDSYKIVEER